LSAQPKRNIDIEARDIFIWGLVSPSELGGVMARKAKRRDWTAGDIRDLKGLAKRKMPAAKIARSLKRTIGATRQKAFSLGVSLNSRG
jgi:hypothetical protein